MSTVLNSGVEQLLVADQRREQEEAAAKRQKFNDMIAKIFAREIGEDVPAVSSEEFSAVLKFSGVPRDQVNVKLDKMRDDAGNRSKAAKLSALKAKIDELNAEIVAAVRASDEELERRREAIAEQRRQVDALTMERTKAELAWAKVVESLPWTEKELALLQQKRQLATTLNSVHVQIQRGMREQKQLELNRIERDLTEIRGERASELLMSKAERAKSLSETEKGLLAERAMLEGKIRDLVQRQAENDEAMNRAQDPVPPSALPIQRLIDEIAKKQSALAEVNRKLAFVQAQRPVGK